MTRRKFFSRTVRCETLKNSGTLQKIESFLQNFSFHTESLNIN